jgi:DNA-binding MarR family transcriptional regulator
MESKEVVSEVTIREAIESLGRLAEMFLDRREQLAREGGLTVPQWQVLEEIAGENFMPSMFARRRESSPAAVSKILRQLLDRDLISVSISQNDGRQREYELTAAGRDALEAVRDARRRAIEGVWMDLDPDEVVRFSEFSDRLVERLEAYASGDARRKEENDGQESV